MYEELLTCGLTLTEQKVLLHLLEYGPKAAGLIAKRLSMKRPTVYSALNNLTALKAVYKERRAKAMVYCASKPAGIPKLLVESARQRFERVVEAANSLESRMREFPDQGRTKVGGFEINLIESTRAYYNMLGNYLREGGYCAIWNPQASLYGAEDRKRLTKFLLEMSKVKNSVREIVYAGPVTNWYRKAIINPKHVLKEFNGNLNTVADLVVVNGRVLLSLNIPGKEVSVEIVNSHFYDFMLEIFDKLWEAL